MLCFKVYSSSNLLQPHISWIMDSGATYHICSNKSLFLLLDKLPHTQYIGLPNGNDTTVSFVYNVPLHESLILTNVLYVPSFKYNLISITYLTSQLKTFVLFTDDECLLQDPSIKNKVALGSFEKKNSMIYMFSVIILHKNLFLFVLLYYMLCQTLVLLLWILHPMLWNDIEDLAIFLLTSYNYYLMLIILFILSLNLVIFVLNPNNKHILFQKALMSHIIILILFV